MQMKKSQIILYAASAAVLLITGCSQAETETSSPDLPDPVNATETAPKTVPAEQPEAEEQTIIFERSAPSDPTKFQEDVSIDMAGYVQDFFTLDMAETIQRNMEAIVSNDSEGFSEGMSEDAVEQNLNLLAYLHTDGEAIEFQSVDSITYLEKEKRIQIAVSYAIQMKEEVTYGSFEYTLIPEKGTEEDRWIIATMD